MKDKRKFIRKDYIEEIKEIIDPMSELTPEQKLNTILNNSKIDLVNKEYKEPPAYLSIKNDNEKYVSVFTPANISSITGKAKSKKTFFQTLLIASVTKNGEIDNTIKADLPKGKENIILFDTEQSIFHVSKVNKRINTMIGNSDNLFVYSLRGLDSDTILDLIKHVITEIKNIGIIFIDQVADLAKSINNEEEAIKIVKTLEKLTAENDIHICCVIHQNKHDNYATGWLGSQIMKKSESVISVQKDEHDNKYSEIKPDLTRSMEFKEFSIGINEKGLPYIIRPIEINVFNPDLPEPEEAPF